jgi:hypothetical protein
LLLALLVSLELLLSALLSLELEPLSELLSDFPDAVSVGFRVVDFFDRLSVT